MLKIKYIAVATLLAMSAANAQDGTINFTGEISDSTCTIDVDGSNSITVTLPTISKTNFPSTGINTKAGQTAFTVDVKDCVPNNGTVGVRFVGTSQQIDTASGLFINTAVVDDPDNAASGVAIGVYDSTDTLVKTAGNSSALITLEDGVGQIPLTAWYVKTAAANTAITPGTVTGAGGIELVYN